MAKMGSLMFVSGFTLFGYILVNAIKPNEEKIKVIVFNP